MTPGRCQSSLTSAASESAFRNFPGEGLEHADQDPFSRCWAHTVGQQVLRVDYEPKSPLPDAIRKKLHQRLSANLRNAHALAVSDYGFGVATPELVQQASAKRNVLCM